MSYALNNITTTDAWQGLPAQNTRRVNIDVANAAIYLELGVGFPATAWQGEVLITPSTRSMDRACDWIRVRSAKAGTPAQVTINALTAGDLGA